MFGVVVFAALSVSSGAAVAAGPSDAWEGRAVDLSAEYGRARSEFKALRQRPDRHRHPELWDDVERKFSAIVKTDPGGAHADEAAFMIGEVNFQRHRLFRERKYLDAAVMAFKRVLASYPLSSRGGDALVRLADIHYYNLDDSRRAYLLYRRAVRAYAETDSARRARIRMIAMEARFPHYVAMNDGSLDAVIPPSRPGRPLPSPGAVQGGRKRRTRSGTATVETQARAADLPGSPTDGAPPVPSKTPWSGSAKRESVDDEEARGIPAPVHSESSGRSAAERDDPHPLLEEGPLPLKSPSDDLPSVRSLRPGS